MYEKSIRHVFSAGCNKEIIPKMGEGVGDNLYQKKKKKSISEKGKLFKGVVEKKQNKTKQQQNESYSKDAGFSDGKKDVDRLRTIQTYIDYRPVIPHVQGR